MFSTNNPFSQEQTAQKIQKWTIVLLMLLLPMVADAQQVQTGLESIREKILLAGNVIFIIGIVVGIIRTVIAFVGNSPNAVRNLIAVIMACLVWYGFNYIVNDISSSLGGSGVDNPTFGN
jgi:hypothetical protein